MEAARPRAKAVNSLGRGRLVGAEGEAESTIKESWRFMYQILCKKKARRWGEGRANKGVLSPESY
uniref:Uncharacterized protein n=1 Tax=Pseudomonas phage Cygsa01 TaxID=3138529 RepID=A0AAU6W461_9VIRU